MTVLQNGNAFRSTVLGVAVRKSTGTLAATTVPLFTVTGRVLVTSLVGEVTTAVTVANAYKLQTNPTVGATANLCATLDIGTTDTPVGETLTVVGPTASALALGGAPAAVSIVVAPGQIEHVSLGTDGAILWRLTYVPLDDGATVVAA